MTLPPIDLEFLNEGSTQGSAMPLRARATGLRPQPPAASSRSGVTIAELAIQALLGTLFLYVLIFAHGVLA